MKICYHCKLYDDIWCGFCSGRVPNECLGCRKPVKESVDIAVFCSKACFKYFIKPETYKAYSVFQLMAAGIRVVILDKPQIEGSNHE